MPPHFATFRWWKASGLISPSDTFTPVAVLLHLTCGKGKSIAIFRTETTEADL
jgi:hypothetical protein